LPRPRPHVFFVREQNHLRFRPYRLRAADAFQLAAALAWCEGHPRGERFLSLDDRLRDAARREGFTVLP